MPDSVARVRSGWDAGMAAECTSRSVPSGSARIASPVCTGMPAAASASVVALEVASLPVTVQPRERIMSASPLMPHPPMPVK